MLFPSPIFCSHFFLRGCLLIPFTTLACPLPSCLPVVSENPPTYDVHEWGTFTELLTSNGTPLEGLFLDASPLPEAVHGLKYFHPAPGSPLPNLATHRGITVKMETPVIYFHSPTPFHAEVKVDFQGGSITQWYPACSKSEPNPVGPSAIMSPSSKGFAQWSVDVLHEKNSSQNDLFTIPYSNGNLEWNAPRAVNANLVRSANGEIEKFLFYRGLGGFPLPLKARILPSGKYIEIHNESKGNIPHILITESPRFGKDTPIRILWEGSLSAGSTFQIPLPAPMQEGYDHALFNLARAGVDSLQSALVRAGLNEDEAQAMLATWKNSYFDQELGLKIFWIMPRLDVDAILPLEIVPAPRSIARVMVGRTELLRPEDEAMLMALQMTNPTLLASIIKRDRFRLAYQDYLAKPPVRIGDFRPIIKGKNGFPLPLIGLKVNGVTSQLPLKNPLTVP